MNKIRLVLIALFFGVFAGCGGGGGGGGEDADDQVDNNVTGGTKLRLFSEQVILYTPYLDETASSSAGSDLKDWSSWDPGVSGSVLGKLFNPAIGRDECIHSLMQVFDAHIRMVNEFSGQWGMPGTYSQGTMTAAVVTAVSTVSIPFLNADFPGDIDRQVTLYEPTQDLTVNMAFAQDGENQTIVEQYSLGFSESGVFLGRISGNRIQVWMAVLNDSKVQIMWECDTSENWFKITEASNASGGNWEVMGGGSKNGSTGQMAFMARNELNNSSNDEYYLTVTESALEDRTEQTVLHAQANPPSPSANEVFAYITEGNPQCPDFFFDPKYPYAIEDLAWLQ